MGSEDLESCRGSGFSDLELLRSRNSDLPDEVSVSKYFDWSALEADRI